MSPHKKTLIMLPREILDTICTQSTLDYHDLLSLRLASPMIAGSIPFTHLKAARALAKQSLLQEEHLEHQLWLSDLRHSSTANPPYLFCYACLNRKPSFEFATTQRTKSRGLMKDEHARRFCTDCGWRKGIWEKGSMRLRGRNTILICRGCGGLSVGALDALCRKYRVCGVTCWGVVVREGGEQGKVEGPALDLANWRGNGVEDREISGQVKAAPTSSKARSQAVSSKLLDVTQFRRQTKCLKCWSSNHTAKPSPQGSRLCQMCESSRRASKG
jgi:hypothetical protein